jgi:hypothetical protein
LGEKVEIEGNVTRQIAFEDSSAVPGEPVVQTLRTLYNYVRYAVLRRFTPILRSCPSSRCFLDMTESACSHVLECLDRFTVLPFTNTAPDTVEESPPRPLSNGGCQGPPVRLLIHRGTPRAAGLISRLYASLQGRPRRVQVPDLTRYARSFGRSSVCRCHFSRRSRGISPYRSCQRRRQSTPRVYFPRFRWPVKTRAPFRGEPGVT